MLRRLASITLMVMVFVLAGTALMAEVALLRWNEERVGWRQGDLFVTCSGEILPLADAAVASTTKKCPPIVASAAAVAPDGSAVPDLPVVAGAARAADANGVGRLTVGEVVTLSADIAGMIALLLFIFL